MSAMEHGGSATCGRICETASLEDEQGGRKPKAPRKAIRPKLQMLLLFRTPAGFALLQVSDVEELSKESSAESLRQIVKPKAFLKFVNTMEALKPTTRLIKSKRHKGLRVFLKAHCGGETLGVAGSELCAAIKDHTQIECVHNSAVEEAIKAVQSQLTELISGLAGQRDTMIIQAIGSLDDRDKELNSHAKWVREWYGLHFPELDKIVMDNVAYAKTVRLMGSRSNAPELDFSEILPREVEAELKKAAMISTGIEATDIDFIAIRELCDRVLSLSEYRAQLYDYLKRSMNATAPNVTALVGELVGARLIAHAGSMMSLAKEPGSTIQIMGNHLLDHASLVSHATPKLKLKIARSLAAKTALAVRYDAIEKNGDNCFGLEALAMLEAKLRELMDIEHRKTELIGKQIGVYIDDSKKRRRGARRSDAKSFKPTADSAYRQALSDLTNEKEPLIEKSSEAPEEEKGKRKEKKRSRKSKEEETKEEKHEVKRKDKKKKKCEEVKGEELGKKEKKKENGVEGGEKAEAGEEKKNKKKRKHGEEDREETNQPSKKKEKKKRKHAEEDEEETELPSKKKEKKKKRVVRHGS